MNAQDEQFMQAALKLAVKGIGAVEPNPAVGCVIVKAGQVIGKGYHKKFGGPHAEINALEDCRTRGLTPEGGTLYVTLEPCCHWGKTGPCTETIINAKVARVVAAIMDPSAHANGKGLEQLRQAGIIVEVGLCESKARRLNAPFFKHVTTGQPWVILKWAQSIDGKLAYAGQSSERMGEKPISCGMGFQPMHHRQDADATKSDGQGAGAAFRVPSERRWITNEASRRDVHRLRRRVGAILVGINTVLADDPLLTPRPSKGRKPVRVVLDHHLRIPLECKLLRTAKTDPVLIYTGKAAVEGDPQRAEQVRGKGAEVLAYEGPGEMPDLRFLLTRLSAGGVQQVLVEGGPHVAASFLREGLVDEICVYIAPKLLGAAGTACLDQPLANLVREIGLDHVRIKSFGDDVRMRGTLENGSLCEKTRVHENP